MKTEIEKTKKKKEKSSLLSRVITNRIWRSLSDQFQELVQDQEKWAQMAEHIRQALLVEIEHKKGKKLTYSPRSQSGKEP